MMKKIVLLLAAAMLLAGQAMAEDRGVLEGPVLLVATDKLKGTQYEGMVAHVAPEPLGGHIGVILNMPTRAEMGAVFFEHEPSKAVKDPIYVGGTFMPQAIVAVVKAKVGRMWTSVELMPGVWLERTARAIDMVIEQTPNQARYYAGHLYWPKGVLADDIRQGYLVVRPADLSKLFLKDTSRLYGALAPRPGTAI